MEELVDGLTGGHVTEVKIVLTSIVAALAIYQVLLMAVGYAKLRLPFLDPANASFVHRAIGDMIVPVFLVVSWLCLEYFGVEDDGPGPVGLHMVSGLLLGIVLAFKIAVVRWWHGLSRFLPALGISVLALFLITWMTTAGVYL